MPEVRYTLMREDVSYVHAHMYGASRTATTILAALAAIGGAPMTLVLSPQPDGANWFLDVPCTIPDTITVLLPAPVYFDGPSNLTILGNVLAWRSDWFQGTGLLTWDTAALPALSGLLSTARLHLQRTPAMAVSQRAPTTGTSWTFTWPSTAGVAGQVLQVAAGGASQWQDAATTLVPGSVPYSALQAVSATDRLLGRSSPGAGTVQEIVCTAAGRALLDDASSAAMRLTLGIPVGSNSQAQYNADGVLGASAGLTLNATHVTSMVFANPGAVRTSLGLGTMAVQQASSVDITDGVVTLGGATRTSVFDVKGRELASDLTATCIAARLWPAAPFGTTSVNGLRIEAMSGVTSSNANFRCLSLRDQPITTGFVYGVQSMITDGTLRYNVYAEGTAPNYLAGRLGIRLLPDNVNYALDVNGTTRVSALTAGGKTPQMAALDAYSSVAAPDFAANTAYIGVRAWPYAPGGAVHVAGVRVDLAEGAGVAGLSVLRGVQVVDQPVLTTGAVSGAYLQVSAGNNRYNLHCVGTAPNFLAGPLLLTTFPANTTRLVLEYDRATSAGMTIQPNADSGAGQAIGLLNTAGAIVGSITTSATTTTYATSSDRRLKRNVQPFTQALATLAQLRPVTFLWNVNDSADVGFLADELQQWVPSAVVGEPGGMNPDGSIKPQAVDFSKIIPLLTAALQELSARVAVLEAAAL